MQVKRIEKMNLSEIVTQELKKLITDGKYKPGDKFFSSTNLARDMGVGYTTIREALKKLEAGDLIEIKHGKGIFIKENDPDLFIVNPIKKPLDVDRKRLLDMLNVRKIVECEAAKLVSRKGTGEDFKRLEKLLNNMKKTIEDTNKFIEYNLNFHLAIAKASGNYILQEILTTLTRLISAEQQVLILKIPHAKEKGYQYHEKIYNAIKNADEVKAVQYMSEHIEDIKKDV